jgi:hypothetical protein
MLSGLSGPHPFTLRQLQYIVSVADELSFGRAAARCRVSQPSLSSQIAQVEEALGVRLFEPRSGAISSYGRADSSTTPTSSSGPQRGRPILSPGRCASGSSRRCPPTFYRP